MSLVRRTFVVVAAALLLLFVVGVVMASLPFTSRSPARPPSMTTG